MVKPPADMPELAKSELMLGLEGRCSGRSASRARKGKQIVRSFLWPFSYSVSTENR